MTIKVDGPRTRSRKMWDKHGSWLILVVVAGFAFNGGAEWQGYKDQRIVQAIIVAGTAERDALRVRLRAVNDKNLELAGQLGPAVSQARAASKDAGEAVQKADQTIDKANKLIEGERNELPKTSD